MPRNRTKRTGTTKSGILARWSRSKRTTRLIDGLRRFGKVSALVVFLLWIGGWLWLSGGFARAGDWSQQLFYDVSASAGFAVTDILVEGRENTDADVLLALLNIERGDPVLAFNPVEAKELIERISWVRAAHVERRLPGTIYIALAERQPLALWQNRQKVRLIDGEGVTLADRGIGDKFARFRHLLIVVGEDAPDHAAMLVAMLAAEPVLEGQIEAATRIGARRWDLTTRGGVVIRLPEDDMGLALRRLADAQEQDRLLDKAVEAIDLREPGRIVVRTAPGRVQEYKASAQGNAI